MVSRKVLSARARNGEAHFLPRPALLRAKPILESLGKVFFNIGERKGGRLDGCDLAVVIQGLGVKAQLGVGVAPYDQIAGLHLWGIRDPDER